MNTRIPINFFLLLLVAISVQAQHCGMSSEALLQLTERLKDNKAQVKNGVIEQRMSPPQYVPLTFHLVARDDGTQRVSENNVLDQVCSLNQDFGDLDMQFYIKQFNYINSTTLFENHAARGVQLGNEQDPFGLDIFIFKSANNTNTVDEGITFGYYSPSKDWLVMRKDQINERSIVLTHEMGHFFSLLHPYNGWDFEPWEEAKHGNPAPRTSPVGIRTELQNGSNCENAGDFLCDTPPDYFFAFGWESCDYSGGALDPNGELVDPDELNYMSNFLGNCEREDYYFSPRQQELMQADLQTAQRAYLNNDFQPIAKNITDTPTLLTPERSAIAENYNLVSFSWSTVNGANQYLLEIDRLPTFAVQPARVITANTFIEVTGLQEDTRYYWRIRPFNEYATCTPTSAPEVFRTGTSTTSLEVVEDWTVFPNPNRVHQELKVKIETTRSFEAKIDVFDSMGRIVLQAAPVISALNKIHAFDTTRLSSGVYIVQVSIGEERFLQKVVLFD